MAINSLTIVGRLAADVEVRNTQSSVPVCNFCVAVDRAYKSGEEKITDWIDCVAWRGTAEFISKYFHKGDWIGVEGKIQTRNWEDQQGNKRKSVEVLVDNVSFIGSKAQSGQQFAEDNSNNGANITAKDDFPF